MSRLARFLLLVFLAWNAGLVALSWALARSSELAHPPVGGLVTIAGLDVHVSDTGSPPTGDPAGGRPALLLLHGASTSLLDFEPSLVPALTERHRLISIDRPGHGYSESTERWADPYEQARIASGVLEALGVERAIWIGHSWSGAVVLAAQQAGVDKDTVDLAEVHGVYAHQVPILRAALGLGDAEHLIFKA